MPHKDPAARRAYQNQRNQRRASGARLIRPQDPQEEQAVRWLSALGVLQVDAEGWAWVDPQALVRLVGNGLRALAWVLGAGGKERLTRHKPEPR